MSKEVKPIRHKKKVGVGTVVIYVILTLWALTTIYPFVWVFFNSFKKKGDIILHSFALPFGDKWAGLEHYALAWERNNIGASYINSLMITIVVTIVVILLAGFCAYGLARYNFTGRKFLQSMVIASMMFPVFSTVIPVFQMMFNWGIVQYDDWWLTKLNVILPQIAGNLSFAIIVLQGFIRGLPLELEESAFLEGCNVFQIFFKIIIPVAKPSFATVAIFTFLWSYNDLFTQLFYLRQKPTFTITVLLNEIGSQAGLNYGMMNAAIILIVVPVLIVYMLLQKNIIKGLTVGAVKG